MAEIGKFGLPRVDAHNKGGYISPNVGIKKGAGSNNNLADAQVYLNINFTDDKGKLIRLPLGIPVDMINISQNDPDFIAKTKFINKMLKVSDKLRTLEEGKSAVIPDLTVTLSNKPKPIEVEEEEDDDLNDIEII